MKLLASLQAMKKRYKVLSIFLILLMIIVNIVGLYIGNIYYQKVCMLNVNPATTGLDYYKSSFDYERFTHLESYNVSITSSFGYELLGTYIFNLKPTNNTVILLHGIGCDRWESMKYADMYLDLGFNVLAYDSRAQGSSGGKDITLGFFEKIDLENIIKWVSWVNPNAIIGVHGESLGAVTALLQAEVDPNNNDVNFYVVDCPYSDLWDLMNVKISGDFMPSFQPTAAFILFYANIVALKKSHFSLHAVSPITEISDVKTPILFIHGSNDTFIPASMSLELYLRKKGPKGIYISPGAEHAMSYLTNTAEYSAKVKQFLTENNLLKK
ncbi:alpha/beta superfamily hydrolase [Desulfosporosinus orientis DSM 765]|uniref:Alpha/beta superfamily hydrolase n=1 Tax=Desulfosporosinus orientis (strain ATCC 19365 / DSM 765 / NCIMB 8382 / VKM B-1628 / Singapore I) TaxID=768706 RepID=G7WH63_DESOD|nr:alpha/beta hydrolase [Desulfosporosinus orientis]AET69571.1 alpha/beta superfamily hydrolase [Desulfosporosinus orientis DSM 765]